MFYQKSLKQEIFWSQCVDKQEAKLEKFPNNTYIYNNINKDKTDIHNSPEIGHIKNYFCYNK